jgi:hypothetical protein
MEMGAARRGWRESGRQAVRRHLPAAHREEVVEVAAAREQIGGAGAQSARRTASQVELPAAGRAIVEGLDLVEQRRNLLNLVHQDGLNAPRQRTHFAAERARVCLEPPPFRAVLEVDQVGVRAGQKVAQEGGLSRLPRPEEQAHLVARDRPAQRRFDEPAEIHVDLYNPSKSTCRC